MIFIGPNILLFNWGEEFHPYVGYLLASILANTCTIFRANSCPLTDETIRKSIPKFRLPFHDQIQYGEVASWGALAAPRGGVSPTQLVWGRAVTGTHFATRVPAYQYPAGTRVPGY